mmetsp:Transcript_32430/g.52513  ORF Transcript_32430/g.52513 Transcript_32430/m.52513 type:complete len:188 (+) Transcript_32430:199-762(+)|eukprot:CAMPEP_0184659692 /NCGR_PEP_ID=MMETSP0308-20130426/30692_1 /TAXON_ID=38269 /ORGANISM="Gloeochaete witrockiana, Strain SAG 46.84" /LENGTH=187 /DNA_ID=CAMNT_0027099711 /DNA_START=138 /DNA_END=701 /DNA_ORIENTATION=+
MHVRRHLLHLLILATLLTSSQCSPSDENLAYNPLVKYTTYSPQRTVPDACSIDSDCTTVGQFPALCCVNNTCQEGNCPTVKCISNSDCGDNDLCCDVFGLCDICPAVFGEPDSPPTSSGDLHPSTQAVLQVAIPAVVGVVLLAAIVGAGIGVYVVRRRYARRKELYQVAKVYPTDDVVHVVAWNNPV